MKRFGVIVFCAFFATRLCSSCEDDLDFPTGFRFGVSTAAYQIEGAWNVSGKGKSIWDDFTQIYPDRIADRTNGDVACDSYYQWQRDIELISDLGLHFYRFSISWPRLLPTGFINSISEDGKKYYNNLIDGLLARGIEPLVTLYHWDLPLKLQELGGWTNPLITDWFADYARLVFSIYGDRVKTWITINEPTVMCDYAYFDGSIAPGIISPDIGPYLCNKHVLLGHAKAWRIYDEEFKGKYSGKVSISNHLRWFEPYSESEEDADLTEIITAFSTGRYTHAIYSNEGGWPPIVESYLAEYSKNKGYSKSVLPSFSSDEIKLIKGTYDFFGLNHYTSRLVRKCSPNETAPFMWGAPVDAAFEMSSNWTFGYYQTMAINPPGIRLLMAWLKQAYGNIEIIITENGYSSTGSNHQDNYRAQFIRDHLEQVLLSIKQDGVNVTAYTYWSLLDNFEWSAGYLAKFGLYEVDFTDSKYTRTPRLSAQYYASVIRNNSLNVPIGCYVSK